jgi:porin
VFQHHHIAQALIAVVLLFTAMTCGAQESAEAQKAPAAPALVRDVENLNYLGGDAAMPPLADSVIDINSRFRQRLLDHGMALRVITQAQYAQNMLDAPVSPHEQVYVGQGAFESAMAQPILTADLHQLHLRNTQLYMGGVWNWVSWNPAGPKSLQLWDLYLYKSLSEDSVQVKAGYISMSLDFIGLFVGGSTATGTQGVYAVLPYEAGLSYFPLTTPAATARLRGPNHTYFKSGAQRSLDPEGGPTEVARNHTGFRFIPHGDKLLLVNEAGYLRNPSKDAHEAWFRAGYIYNWTAYKNVATGQSQSGNYCGYVLMDYQLRRSNLEHPSHGVYAGGSFMTVPDSLNPYARYYEVRLYKEAPFQNRPADLASLVASRTGYSSVFTDRLVSEGKTAWRGGTTLTGSYSMRASAGNYVSLALTYLYGPAITPRVPNALKFTATWTVFF